jgi:glycosyltransferase involved in cell wall biosynthesis
MSVVVPVEPEAGGLEETLASLVGQSTPPDEILLVAAGPDQELWERVLSLQRDQPALVAVRQQRPGLIRAIDAGLSLAAGRYLTWLLPGCRLTPRALAQMREALDSQPEAGLAFGLCPHTGRTAGPEEEMDWPERLLQQNPVGCAFLLRAENVRSVGPLRQDHAEFAPWDLWIRLSEQCEIAALPEMLCACEGRCPVAAARPQDSAAAAAFTAAHRRRRERDAGPTVGAKKAPSAPAAVRSGVVSGLRVLMLAPEFSSTPGYAVGSHIRGLVRALAQRGYQVQVLSPRARFPGLSGTPNVHLHAPASRPPFGAPNAIADLLQEQALLLAAALEASGSSGPFDLIHLHSWVGASLAHSLCQALGCPLVVTVHRLDGMERGAGPQPDQLYVREIMAWICEEADQVVCLSRFAADQVRQAYRVRPDKIALARLAVDSLDWQTDADIAAFRHLFGPAESRIVTFAGRLEGGKGSQVLVEALPHILAVAPHARVVIAGEGPLEPMLRARLQELDLERPVTFTGYLTGKVFATLLWSSDVLVAPSLMEMSGQGVAEAMLCGLPVVASAVGGTPELIEHEASGLLVPPDDPKALAQAVVRLLYDRELAAELAHEGQRRVLDGHLWQEAVRDVLGIYARVESKFARV